VLLSPSRASSLRASSGPPARALQHPTARHHNPSAEQRNSKTAQPNGKASQCRSRCEPPQPPASGPSTRALQKQHNPSRTRSHTTPSTSDVHTQYIRLVKGAPSRAPPPRQYYDRLHPTGFVPGNECMLGVNRLHVHVCARHGVRTRDGSGEGAERVRVRGSTRQKQVGCE
jgi:hypothetical protein